MKPSLGGLVAAFLILAAISRPAHAQPPTAPRIPPVSLYPPSSLILVAASVSNHAMYCQWSINCSTSNPNTHTRSPHSLGRISGWEARGEWQNRTGGILIDLWGSVYRDWQAARNAMSDFNYEAQQPSPALTPFPCPSPLADPTSGRSTCFHTTDASVHYLEYAVRRGPVELEMLVLANTRYNEARRLAFAQLQYAMGTTP